jgi:hypothetical protein
MMPKLFNRLLLGKQHHIHQPIYQELPSCQLVLLVTSPHNKCQYQPLLKLKHMQHAPQDCA